jgi:hypothetical protein
MARDNIVNKSTTKDSPSVASIRDFKVGKWYKCTNSKSTYLEDGKYYQLERKDGDFLSLAGSGGPLHPERFDASSERDFDSVSSEIKEPKLDEQEDKGNTCIGTKTYQVRENGDLDVYINGVRYATYSRDSNYQSATVVKGRSESVVSNIVYDPQTNILFNQQEEINMSNRKRNFD